MKRHRATITTLTLLALSAASPATAAAGSLLSGYGGPGVGSQAVIGSTLINPPSGGGSATVTGASASASAGAIGSPTNAAQGASAARSGSASGSRGHGRSATAKLPGAAGEGSRSQKTYGLIAPRASVESSPTLGVSSADLLYIVLAMGALLLTGAFTAKLARPQR